MKKITFILILIATFFTGSLLTGCEELEGKSRIYLRCDEKKNCLLYMHAISIDNLAVEYAKMTPVQKKRFKEFMGKAAGVLIDYATLRLRKGLSKFIKKTQEKRKKFFRRYYQKRRKKCPKR